MTRASQVKAIQIARAQSATVTMSKGMTQVPRSTLNFTASPSMTNPISTAFTGALLPSHAGTRDSATWFRTINASTTSAKTLKALSVDVRIPAFCHRRGVAGRAFQTGRSPHR